MKKKIIILIIVIFLLIGISLGTYFYVIKNINKETKSTKTKTVINSSTNEEIVLNDESYEITKGGTYTFTGKISNGSITTNTDDEVKLILNSVTINNDNGASIEINGNGNTNIVLEGENTLTSGTSYSNQDVDGVIYSKADLTISGDGTLNVTSNYEDGIVSKDDLEILGGVINVNSMDDGIKGKDSVTIENANVTINAGGSGIKATNEEDFEKGYIEIKSGSFNINATDNGIKSITKLTINGGTFNISSSECLESTYIVINDGDISINASDDGINASVKSTFMTPTIEINGGTINITMGQGDTDGLDSNGNLYINGGSLNINAQSPFDYDGEGKLNGGTVIVNGSEVTELSNQMMGGPGGMPGDMGPRGRY